MTLEANRIWVAAARPERDRNTTQTGKLTFFASRIAMTHTTPPPPLQITLIGALCPATATTKIIAQSGGSARVLPDPPVTLSREIGLGSILRSTGPNVSEANEIPGEPTSADTGRRRATSSHCRCS